MTARTSNRTSGANGKKTTSKITLEEILDVSAPISAMIQEGVVMVDAASNVRFINEAAAAICGCESHGLVNMPLEELCGKAAAARLCARDFKIFRQTSLLLTGASRVRALASPIVNGEETLGAVIVLPNEHMRNRVDPKAFKQSHNLVRAIDKLKDRVCIVNDVKRGGHAFISDSIKLFTGWPADMLVNGSWALMMTIFHPEDLRATADKMKETFAKYALGTGFESEPYQSRYRLRHADGRWIEIEENGCLLERDEDGFPRYLISFLDVVDNGIRHVRRSAALDLTPREMDVAYAVVQGESSKIIAARFGLSVHTVNEVRKRLLQKTGAANTASLVKFLSEHEIR